MLAVGAPELSKLVRQLPGGGRCLPSLGHDHPPLRGRAADGSYRTAPAKTYGPALCRMLAQVAVAEADRRLQAHRGVRPEDRDLPDEVAGLYVHLDRYGPPDRWTHDCARGPAHVLC